MKPVINRQNDHILKKIEDVSAAAKALVAEDLTITHIEIEGVYPRINLLNEPKRQNRLPISTKTIRRTEHGRQTEITACVEGCEVRWLERT